MTSVLPDSEVDAYLAALELVSEGARLVTSSASVPEVADRLLATASLDVLRVAARLWLSDRIHADQRASTRIAERAAEQAAEVRRRRLFERQRTPGTPEHAEWTQTEEGRAWVEDREKSDREHERRMAEIQTRHMARMQQNIADWAAELKIEWTRELLDSVISMPDGTRTTWAAATVEQHRERAEMFAANAVANAEGAARHLKAIEELQAVGVSCLAELVASRKAARVAALLTLAKPKEDRR